MLQIEYACLFFTANSLFSYARTSSGLPSLMKAWRSATKQTSMRMATTTSDLESASSRMSKSETNVLQCGHRLSADARPRTSTIPVLEGSPTIFDDDANLPLTTGGLSMDLDTRRA